MLKTITRIALAVGLAAALAAPGRAADFRLDRELDLAPGGRFELDTDAGRLVVRGSDRSGVSLRVSSDRPQQEIESRYDFSIDSAAGRVSVRVERRGRSWFNRGDDLLFEIDLPRRTELDLETAGGSIEVEEIAGRVDLETSGGRIELERIGGDVDAHTSGGGIVAEELGGDARLHTSGGGMRVKTVAGDLIAETSGGSIEIRDAGGRVEASTSGGPVTASFTRGNARGGSLSTSGGGVTIYVDPEVGLDIDASTSGGSVSVDLPVTVRGRLSLNAISGTLNGGGASLRVRSSGGSIRLRSL